MRTALLFLLMTTFLARNTAAEEPLVRPLPVQVWKLVPNQWSVEEITINAVPYNHGIKADQRPGTCVKLVGPTSIGTGQKGQGTKVSPQRESVHLWIMPADYTPIPPRWEGQAVAATFLGSNETIALYGKSFFGSPSWPTWEKDVVHRFGLTDPRNLPVTNVKPIPAY